MLVFLLIFSLFSLMSSSPVFTFYASAESVFRARLTADPQTLDWNLASTTIETYVLTNLMEGLFSFDKNMKIQNVLAKSYEISNDKRTYTIKIKENVKWSDGKPLSAQHFYDSWKRLLDPLTAAPYAYILFDIKRAKDFNSGKIKDFSKVGVRVVNAKTLQVTLEKPTSVFLQKLTFWVTFPIRKDLIQKYKRNWTKAQNLAVLGPFQLHEREIGTVLTLKKNYLYHGYQPELQKVVFQIVHENSTALNLFHARKLDFVRPINLMEIKSLKKTPEFHSSRYFRTDFLHFNLKKYPVNILAVRQAISLAIDKTKIENLFHDTRKPAFSLVDPILLPEAEQIAPEFNPAKAKKILRQSGVTKKALSQIDLISFNNDENALLTQYIQNQLKTHLGIEIKIRALEYKTYRSQLELGSGALALNSWGADYADPESYLEVFQSNSGNNFTAWKNSQYDKLLEQAGALSDQSQRNLLYTKASKLLIEKEAIVIPLNFQVLSYLLRKNISGFMINPLNYVYLKNIVIE